MIIKQMEQINNKKKGIIYKIEFGDYLYVGSSKQKYLSQRQGNHNSRLRENKRQHFLYKKCRELGIEKIECIFIKNFYYDTIEELVQEEEKYRIMLNSNLNSNKCFLSEEEKKSNKKIYNIINKDKISQQQKEFHKNNKEHVNNLSKKYYNTKEERREYVKNYNIEYYENNKNKYKELSKNNYIKNGSVICDNCGSTIIKCNLKRHKKSKKCLDYNKNE